MADSSVNLRPATTGNLRAVTHGAYSPRLASGRAREIADGVRGLVPFGSAADDAAVDTLALCLAQIELAGVALQAARGEQVRALQEGQPLSRDKRDWLMRLSQDCRGWVSTATRLFEQLGLTPMGHMKLRTDAARGADAVARLHEYLAENYSDAGDAA